MNEIPWSDWLDKNSANQLNIDIAWDNLANTLNQRYETLHTFKDFDEFKNSKILNLWTEFEPNIIQFTVTDGLIDKYSEMFNDSFTPHVIIDESHQSFPSKLLWQSPENNTKFLQGIGTLSFLNGFVRRVFKFQDKTELLTPKMNKVTWPTPNPSWSNMTSKFIIKDKRILDVKIWEQTFEAVKIVFDAQLFSDKITTRPNEDKPRPVCIAEWEMLYISPNAKNIIS